MSNDRLTARKGGQFAFLIAVLLLLPFCSPPYVNGQYGVLYRSPGPDTLTAGGQLTFDVYASDSDEDVVVLGAKSSDTDIVVIRTVQGNVIQIEAVKPGYAEVTVLAGIPSGGPLEEEGDRVEDVFDFTVESR